MQLTGQRQVEMEQREDGAVIIRPIRSILHLAGCLKTGKPLLSPEAERREVHKVMAERRRNKRRR